MTLPTLNPTPPKHSSSTLKALTSKIDKGSQKYRQILTKSDDFVTEGRLNSWKEALNNNNITKESLRSAFKLTQWKLFDADTKDYILKFLTRKTIFNNQVERAYPNVKPEWFTDIYCHSCKEELGELIPETCEHAMVTCQFVSAARATFFQHLNPAMTPIEPNLPEDSILWTPGEALGPSQTTTSSLIFNAVKWLSSVEILKCKFKKITPNVF